VPIEKILKTGYQGRTWWFILVIPATWKARIGGYSVQAKPEQKLGRASYI
jgi:hypothetical protein